MFCSHDKWPLSPPNTFFFKEFGKSSFPHFLPWPARPAGPHQNAGPITWASCVILPGARRALSAQERPKESLWNKKMSLLTTACSITCQYMWLSSGILSSLKTERHLVHLHILSPYGWAWHPSQRMDWWMKIEFKPILLESYLASACGLLKLIIQMQYRWN